MHSVHRGVMSTPPPDSGSSLYTMPIALEGSISNVLTISVEKMCFWDSWLSQACMSNSVDRRVISIVNVQI